ncbi:MAG: hypothetical protein JWO06_2498 [Bacteroidota bacterium]|nr:hypothetical protein [Bacteroidota bacterium]
MAFFDEVTVQQTSEGIVLVKSDPLMDIFIKATVAIIAFSFYKLVFWFFVIVLIIFLFLIFSKNELLFSRDKLKIFKRTTLFGFVIGKVTEFNMDENNLFFDFAILMDAGVGQTYYYRLCMKGEQEQLLLFEDKGTVDKIEKALIQSGVIKNELPKFKF